MTDAPLLIHVGYHKTATTWLQNAVFRPEHGFNWVLTHDETFAHVVMPHGLAFDPSAASGIIAARRGQKGEGSVDVISLEALVGNPFFGGRESDEYAGRMREIAPKAQILITIREQCRMISSTYMQYLFRGGTLDPGAFLAGETIGGYFGFDPAHFEYDRLVGLYQELFGHDAVIILPMETIARDQAETVARLAAQTGNTAIGPWADQSVQGASYPEAAYGLLRRINHLRDGPAHRGPIADLGGLSALAYRAAGRTVDKLGRRGRPVTALAEQRFAGAYVESNRRLVAMLPRAPTLAGYQGISDA